MWGSGFRVEGLGCRGCLQLDQLRAMVVRNRRPPVDRCHVRQLTRLFGGSDQLRASIILHQFQCFCLQI